MLNLLPTQSKRGIKIIHETLFGIIMHFNPTEEQAMYRETIARFLDDRYSVAHRQQFLEQRRGYNPENWSALADLGVLSLPIPHGLGGLGGTAAEIAIIQEELGYRLAVEPFSENIVIPAVALQEFDDEGRARTLAAEMQAGTKTVGVALSEGARRFDAAAIACRAKIDGGNITLWGTKHVVSYPEADFLLVSAILANEDAENGLILLLVPAGTEGISTRTYRLIDGTLAADFEFENTRLTSAAMVASGAGAVRAIEGMHDRGARAAVAESLGILRRMFELTTEYTNSRVQFGRPLTGNQVVRHRLAEMLMHYELARSVVAGLCIFPAGTHHAAKLVSAAKVTVAKAFDFIGKQSIQLHGGIGLTDEYELSHHYKRGLALQEMYGNKREHALRLAKLSTS